MKIAPEYLEDSYTYRGLYLDKGLQSLFDRAKHPDSCPYRLSW